MLPQIMSVSSLIRGLICSTTSHLVCNSCKAMEPFNFLPETLSIKQSMNVRLPLLLGFFVVLFCFVFGS